MAHNSGATPGADSFRFLNPPIPVAVRERSPDAACDPDQGTLAQSSLHR
jgi:hypothetical protein